MTPRETVTKNPVGRPPTRVTPEQVWKKWSEGESWRQIAKALGIGTATAMRLLDRFFQATAESRPNIQETNIPNLSGRNIIREVAGTKKALKQGQAVSGSFCLR